MTYYVCRKDVAELVGRTTMTVFRWQNDPRMNFPQPVIVNNRPLFDMDEITRWLKARKLEAPKAKSA